MKITISDEAANWYKSEMNLAGRDYVRFFVRYGGCSTVQSGFSLGVASETPINSGVQTEKNGIVFFIEEKDLWYFDEHDLNVEFDSKHDEPIFNYSN